MPESIPAVAYVRVSAVGQRDVESTSYQTETEQAERADAFARSQGYTVIDTIVDRDVSGGKWDRAGLNRVMERAERGEIRAVIVYRLSRLGRGLRGVLETVAKLQEFGCAILSVSEALDLSTSQGRLMLNLLASFDEYEREVRKEYWQATKARAFNRGVHLGPTPFGYRRGATKVLEPDPETQNIVRELFHRRAEQGVPFLQLAEWLDTIRPAPRGGAWQQAGVARMLRRRVYLGEIQWEGAAVAGAHEPLVTREIFAQVQARDAGLARSNAPHRTFLLSGIVRCAACGRTMSGRTKTDGKVQPIYRCRARTGSYRCPAPAYIQAADMEREVAEAVLGRMRGDSMVGGAVEADLPSLRDTALKAESEVMEYLADTAMRDLLGEARWRAGMEARVRASEAAAAALEAAEGVGPEDRISPDAVAGDPELLAAAIGGAVREVRVTKGRGSGRFEVVWR